MKTFTRGDFLRAMNNEGNILAQAWKKRYEALAPDIQKRLDDLSRHFDRGESDHYKLQYIKKSYVLPETGDVFVCKPVNDLYYSGVVLNAHIKNMIGDDMYVVLIFNSHSDSIDRIDFKPDYESILLVYIPFHQSRLHAPSEPPCRLTRATFTEVESDVDECYAYQNEQLSRTS